MGARAQVEDHVLLDFVLSHPGATDSEIGKALGLSRVQICRRRNDSRFQQLVEAEFRASFDLLRTAHVKAIRKICAALDSADPKIMLRAAALVLERGAMDPPPHKQRDRAETLRSLANNLRRFAVTRSSEVQDADVEFAK